MNLPRHFVFSQASLQDYADCPRRFQLRYVLDVRWPRAGDESSAEWERRAKQGAAFHQLVHQHILGIPVEALDEMARQGELEWWHAYLQTPPAHLPARIRRSEIHLSTPIAGYRLAARYDLLAIDPGDRAVIVDWKTNDRRPKRSWLEGRWQTHVYRYVLVQAGAHLNGGVPLAAEQVELVYWFAQYPAQPERFSYDVEQHQAAERTILDQIAQIEGSSQQVWSLAEDLGKCRYCTYRTLCERVAVEVEDESWQEKEVEDSFELVDLEQIAEVEF
jgi:CRISPR/Cas system-associated exonuclease Cas4 (RecB family)